MILHGLLITNKEWKLYKALSYIKCSTCLKYIKQREIPIMPLFNATMNAYSMYQGFVMVLIHVLKFKRKLYYNLSNVTSYEVMICAMILILLYTCVGILHIRLRKHEGLTQSTLMSYFLTWQLQYILDIIIIAIA